MKKQDINFIDPFFPTDSVQHPVECLLNRAPHQRPKMISDRPFIYLYDFFPFLCTISPHGSCLLSKFEQRLVTKFLSRKGTAVLLKKAKDILRYPSKGYIPPMSITGLEIIFDDEIQLRLIERRCAAGGECDGCQKGRGCLVKIN